MEQKYMGITPYSEDGGFEFAGRNEETWALYDRIVRNEYTVYYAASGEGKSSLIRAGLLPILRRRNFFPVYIVFEDRELRDSSNFDNVLYSRIENEAKKHNVAYEQSTLSKSIFSDELSEKLTANIWWKIRNFCFKRNDTELKPLFIFDQFEEVFTKASYDWTNKFFSWLEEISTDYLPSSLREDNNLRGVEVPTKKNFKALFSFRTEYLGDLDYWCVQKHFIPALQENRMCLKPLTKKGAREVVYLNEPALGRYADRIIQGCADSLTTTTDENQPCVYALILSVVCQTLSEATDAEREKLLEKLMTQQDETIDDILLRFYKEKLKDVGLDYIKDEKIVAGIEDALVDEKGKRSRRDTDEESIKRLSKWTEKLCANGLLKIIGVKEVDGIIVNTVEFPHDRLCKAIDSARKARQGKIQWKLIRQAEWMQFGIIATLIGLIAFLWNTLLPAIRPVIVTFLYDSEAAKKLFFTKYLLPKSEPSFYKNLSLDEGFSTLLLLALLTLFIPLITTFIVRKSKKWQITSAAISALSFLSFLFLCYKNIFIHIENNYVTILPYIGVLCSFVALFVSTLKLKTIYSTGESKHQYQQQYSIWPLWGGFLLFAGYFFYEFLCRTTFGISEPCDSFWAPIIPLFYTFWAWGFFNVTFDKQHKPRVLIAFIASVLFLSALSYIGILSYRNDFKHSYGFTTSIVLILLWSAAFAYMAWSSKSKTPYYLLSKPKCLFATAFAFILISTTFVLNLGFNPLEIAPQSVCHVSSWREVIVFEEDSVMGKKIGIRYSTNGETIIPCCSTCDLGTVLDEYKNARFPIRTKFETSPLNDSIKANNDGSLTWESFSRTLTAIIPTTSTLEQYLHGKLSGRLSKNSSQKDSIDYYAAKLFVEIRNANIAFATRGEVYNVNKLASLNVLDSLQHIALSNELQKFAIDTIKSRVDSTTTISSRGGKIIRPTIDVLEDNHLVDFHCELARSMFLCLIKDRASQSDMPSMFSLARLYLLTYFTSVPAMSVKISFNSDVAFNSTINVEAKDTNVTSDKKVNNFRTIEIISDDILNRRCFAWYNLFECLCTEDMAWNAKNYQNRIMKLFDDLDAYGEIQKKIIQELGPAVTSPNEVLKNCKNASDSTACLVDVLKAYKNATDSKYYESKLSELENIDLSIKTIAVDQSLKQLKDNVLNTLLPVMERNTTGVYNNDFENICINLINVSAMRGNDITNDIVRISKYRSNKYALHDVIKETHTITNVAGDVVKGKRDVESLMRQLNANRLNNKKSK